jgi:hypothetical protein
MTGSRVSSGFLLTKNLKLAKYTVSRLLCGEDTVALRRLTENPWGPIPEMQRWLAPLGL